MKENTRKTNNSEQYPFGFLAEIFGRIWALWALLLFVGTMIIFIVPFLLFCYFRPDPLKTIRFISFSRVWMGIFLYGVGCPLKIRGKEFFENGETFIVVCNHNSLIDVPVSSPGIPGGNKTIAKIEMARIPIFSLLYKTGSVLVDRKNDASRRESFTKMKEVLDMGLHMCIYPEGTRNKTDQPLKHFHDGAFRLALMTGKRIVPAVIFNSKRALPASKSFFIWPQPLAMHFLPPVDFLPDENIDSLRERTFKRMWEYFEEHADSMADRG
jgi:1-acyl-sn-glycerol-3-phosphate acyltransferase